MEQLHPSADVGRQDGDVDLDKERDAMRRYLLDVDQVLIPAKVASTPKKMKSLAPQDLIDEFWTKFNSKTPGKGSHG